MNKSDLLGKNFRINFIGFRKIIRNPALSLGAKVVLTDILLYAGIDGNSFPSQTKIAKDLGISTRYIQDLKNELKNKGVLYWERGKKGKSNLYKFNEEIYYNKDRNIRNNGSNTLGNTVPLPIRIPVLPNVVIESSQESSQSAQLQQLFEKTAKRSINQQETKQLYRLSEQYSYPWVEDAISEASKRNYPTLRVNLIGLILGDWKKDGKPSPRPTFTACRKGRCDEQGMIFNKDNQSYMRCPCKVKYDKELGRWKKEWGN